MGIIRVVILFYFSDTNVKGPKRPPPSVQVFGVNSTTVRITWNAAPISEGEEPIKGYKVRIWDESDDASLIKEIIVPDGEKLETIVDSLQSDYLYKMRVLAFSDSGDGRMTTAVIRYR